MANRTRSNSRPGSASSPASASDNRALFLLVVMAMSVMPHRAAQSPRPESIPDTVARLKAEVLNLSTRRQELERNLLEHAQSIARLEQELGNARATLESALGDVKSLLRDGPPRHELVLAHRQDHAELRCSRESVDLVLASSAHEASTQMLAMKSGGVLKFSQGSEKTVAQLGTDSGDGAGVLELAGVARLGSQSSQRGGGLTLFNRKGQVVAILGTTADGSGLVLGDPKAMSPNLPLDRQRGIVLSMTSKGSIIQIDGKRLTGH